MRFGEGEGVELQDQLQRKFLAYQVDDELPAHTSDDLDHFWHTMSQKVDMNGQLLYPKLSALMKTLLVLPHSNADSERVFSMVRQIKTEVRSELDNTTVCSLLSAKINQDHKCYECKPSKELLSSAKIATRVYNQKHTTK